MPRRAIPSFVRIAGVLGAIGGAGLFVWSLRRAGVGAVFEGVTRVGFAFVLVLILGGVRQAVRATAWWLCLDRRDRFPLAAAFAAYVSGDAVGNITPFGALVSEPSKIVLVRNRVSTGASVAALAVENLFYSGSVVAMLAAGTAALLWVFPVPPAVRLGSLATLAVAIVAALLVAWVVVSRRPVASRVTRWFVKHDHTALDRVRDVESRIFGFAADHRSKVAPVAALEAAYHAAAVAEIWIVLAAVTGSTPSLLTAFVLEYVNRTITIAFQFVPLWLGVDEAGTGLMTGALNLGAATGVTLALVRKGRNLIWTAIGLGLIATSRRPATIRPRAQSVVGRGR